MNIIIRAILSFSVTLAFLAGCDQRSEPGKSAPATQPAAATPAKDTEKTPAAAKDKEKDAEEAKALDALPAAKKVNVYMWSEYIDPKIPEAFEKETGLKVRIDVYESTEDMQAKLQQAGGDRQYDVVVASDHVIPVLAKLKLIQPLPADKIANKANVAERFQNPSYDPGSKYSLPYQWGTMGLIYRKDKAPQLEASWAAVFDEAKQPGPFVLIDSMRDMMAAALKFQGQSINARKPEQLKAAGELILKAKKSPKMVAFEGGVGGKNKVASGDATLAIVYNGDAIRALDEDKNLEFVVPKEGTLIWVDAMTIPAHAPNLEGACKFINYMLDANVGAQLSNFNRYATPNAKSMPMIEAKDRENPRIYPSEELMKKMEYLEDLGDDTRLYDETWTAIKSR